VAVSRGGIAALGTDIRGRVEIKDEWLDDWVSVVNIGPILSRQYDMFACLFGVMNYANFRPLAPERGIPADTSQEVARDLLDHEQNALFPTWIGWDEIQAIDWNEAGIKPDERVHRYEMQDGGHLRYVSKGVHPYSDMLNFDEEYSWEEDDGYVYKIETISRAAALEGDPGWPLLFKIMDLLARQNPRRLVRLVVWFEM
jgi:hypothetical protein